VLAHHGHRLLEELTEASAAYTLRLLKQEGIAVRLNTSVTRVTEDSVELEPGGTIPTRMVCWTAGVAPSSLLTSLDVPKDHHGALVVDGHLAVQDQPGLWAIGDCASVPNPHDGGTYAPLAQNAEREGPIVAHNVLATLRGDPLKTFDYRLQGTFASLGKRTAVGQVFGRQYSGLAAWFLWRGVYLSKLPGWDRKIRVGIDWLLDFVLQPDVVNLHTDDRGPGNPSPPAPPAPAAHPDTAGQPTDGPPTAAGTGAAGSASAAPAGSASGTAQAAAPGATPPSAGDTTESASTPTPGA
jgi:NADH dehydrogenase